jgi:Radical SAM superfamily
MKIVGLKLGHATNSSSSHSIVITDQRYKDRVYEDFNYNWENFTLASTEAKLKYLFTAVFNQLSQSLGKKAAYGACVELFKNDLCNLDEVSPDDIGSIDHQSALRLPFSSDSNNPEVFLKAIEEMIHLFSQDDIVIFGGNDNDEEPWHKLKENEREITAGRYIPKGKPWFRVVQDGGNYVVYNRQSGAKALIQTNPNKPFTKGTFPHLVDIKLTDNCPYACEFCYQSSTKEGKDSKFNYLYDVINEFSKLGTLEIAFGGGETPSSSNFVDAISLCKQTGITPNFTCFGTAWLKDNQKVAAAKKCGGIGVSVHTVKDLQKLVKIREAVGSEPVITAQFVMQATEENNLLDVLDACLKNNIPVLLLGYKNVGFGVKCQQHPITDATFKALESWQEEYGPTLSVDTAFVDNHNDLLTKLDVSRILITSPEGKFSCYIDAVKKEIGPSSYGDASSMSSLDDAKLIKHFFESY